MDWDDWLIALAIILLSPFVLAIWALFANRALRRRVDELTEKFRMFDHRLIRLAEALAGAGPPPATSTPLPEPASPAEPIFEPVAPLPEPARPEAQPAFAPAAAASAAPPLAPVPATTPRTPSRWEQMLAENWLVWLGGVTLALGGAFLVKLSIDYGLLTPAVRVVAGDPARYRPRSRRRLPRPQGARRWAGPRKLVLCRAGACRRRRRDRLRQRLRRLSALRPVALGARLPAARRDRRCDDRDVAAPRALRRRARPRRRLCRAGAGGERQPTRAAAVRLSRLRHRGRAGLAAPPRVVVAGLAGPRRRHGVAAAVAGRTPQTPRSRSSPPICWSSSGSSPRSASASPRVGFLAGPRRRAADSRLVRVAFWAVAADDDPAAAGRRFRPRQPHRGLCRRGVHAVVRLSRRRARRCDRGRRRAAGRHAGELAVADLLDARRSERLLAPAGTDLAIS